MDTGHIYNISSTTQKAQQAPLDLEQIQLFWALQNGSCDGDKMKLHVFLFIKKVFPTKLVQCYIK